MNEHVWADLARARMRELHAEAAAERLCRRVRSRRRVTHAVRRGYARAWWALRPRAASWTPGLFEP
ncbi:hypothetical protein WIS52_10010 [Pseudonocardia nematodicida]|uniref:Uncharacterized protein n=1 Tax=Pseudonocardia nematodicida TaxID=1206997 RepID=A0ABV1K9G7_9PSEU